MNKQSLGLIETTGFCAAIEAADVALKAANVTLLGYELSNGGGMVAVKLLGEISAVNAAVDAATMAANRINKVVSTKVIARPSNELKNIVFTKDTMGYTCTQPLKARPSELSPQQVKVPESSQLDGNDVRSEKEQQNKTFEAIAQIAIEESSLPSEKTPSPIQKNLKNKIEITKNKGKGKKK